MQQHYEKRYERIQWAVVLMGPVPPVCLSKVTAQEVQFSTTDFLLSEDPEIISYWIAECYKRGYDVDQIPIEDTVLRSVN